LVCEIQAIIADKERKDDVQDGELPRTIFQTLLTSDLPAEEKSLDRVAQEAQVVIGAGSDTVANALTVTTFHILNNPEVLMKLKQELETAMPDRSAPTKLSVVERLSYLVSISLLLNVLDGVIHSCSASGLDLLGFEAAVDIKTFISSLMSIT
jgi:cytochrome P450